MPNVEFNESLVSMSPMGPKKSSTLAGWLVEKGVAQSEKQANFMLLGLALTFVTISIYIVLSRNPDRKPVPQGYKVIYTPGKKFHLEKIN